MTEQGSLYRLMAWLSPSFPVGGYSYSHGLEYAIEIGAVTDARSLTEWVGAIVTMGAGRIDAALFLAAHRATLAADDAALDEAAELADALRGTAETAHESASQGTAFVSTLRAAWPDAFLDRWHSRLKATGTAPAYAMAVGVAAARAGLAEQPALTAFLQAFAANLISAAVRLIPLGQTDGQRTVAALEATIVAAAEAALDCPFADIGSAAAMVDWTSMMHETQYTRLFRS